MNARSALVLALVALVTLAACSSEPSPPARVTNYGPAPTYAPSAAPYGMGSPDGGSYAATPSAPALGGTVNWHYSLAEAQAEANATGKLLLCLSTKPRCGMCEKFKTKTAPSTAGELNRMAVGYIYDITRPGEAAQIDQVLRANLRGADLMPLVGFLTPDLRWVHGFWGARSVDEFRGDIATARRIHPLRTAQVVPPNRVGGPALAVVNEFGEPEWSLPGDVWPQGNQEPIDAITGAPDLLAEAAPTPPPAAPLAEVADLPAPPPPEPAPSAPAAAPATSSPWSAPSAVSGAVADRGLGAAAPEAPTATSEVIATAESVEAPETTQDPVDLDQWGREALELARTQIQAGQFTEARTTLSEVHERLPGTALAREAAKGGVALYNAKRIRLAANGAERTRYLSRARRDFGASMWSVLFDS